MRQVNKLDNKLKDLSRPVAWIIGEKEIEEFKRGYETFVVRGDDVEGSEPTMELYSKECVSALMADNEYMRWRIKEIDLLFGKNLLAMRAAVIEAEHGEGHTAGMQWIFNTLFGPGEFAPVNETDAQAYFNREAEKIDVEFSKCMAFFTAHHEEKKGQAMHKFSEPVTQDYKLNSPETPDGWIACTEQTPDADGAYWCWFGKEEPSVIQQRVCIWINRNNEWCDSAVTHWMPLPAAPTQGEKQ